MSKTLTAVVLLAIVAMAQAQFYEPNANIIELDDENFVSQTSNGEAWLVEFYAPWCGHCQALKPTYIELASTYTDVHFAAFDAYAQTNREVADDNGITGYPTLRLYVPNLPPTTYHGKRTVEDITAWLDAKIKKAEAITGLDINKDGATEAPTNTAAPTTANPVPEIYQTTTAAPAIELQVAAKKRVALEKILADKKKAQKN